MKKYIKSMVEHTDLWPWYWLSYGEKCYAFAVVDAYPLSDSSPFPPHGSRLVLAEKEGKTVWMGKGDVEMIIESEIANIEAQNGDTICEFIANAHAVLMKEHLNSTNEIPAWITSVGENNMKLFVVGRYITGDEFNIVWDFHGVFDSEEKALEVCEDETYFIGPVELNKILPIEITDWPGAYYPKQRENKV